MVKQEVGNLFNWDDNGSDIHFGHTGGDADTRTQICVNVKVHRSKNPVPTPVESHHALKILSVGQFLIPSSWKMPRLSPAGFRHAVEYKKNTVKDSYG